MEPVLLIHGYSSESAGETDKEIKAIYGSLSDDLRKRVQVVNVSRYVSLDDDVSLEDISLALQRALVAEHPDLLRTGFNAIVHSTGALVIRNWIRRFSTPESCPCKRVVYLAGALLGSGWAHIGESMLAKWGRFFFQKGAERGMAVLDGLEFASDWTLDLHKHFISPGSRMLEDYKVMEFCIIGSQVPAEWMIVPFRYGKEDGSDGVVRVSAGNLNLNYLRIGPKKETAMTKWESARAFSEKASGADVTKFNKNVNIAGGYYEIKEISLSGDPGQAPRFEEREAVPHAIPYECAHSTDAIGVMVGAKTKAQVQTLILQALECPYDIPRYRAVAQTFIGETEKTYKAVAAKKHGQGIFAAIRSAALRIAFDSPEGQYDKHAQIIVRVRDQYGVPVKDFSVYFNSMGGEGTSKVLIDKFFEDKHLNNTNPNAILFYLRLHQWDESKRIWVDRLPSVAGVDMEVDILDTGTARLLYIPLRLRLTAAELQRYVQPHQTTIIDVELSRLPSNDTFMVR